MSAIWHETICNPDLFTTIEEWNLYALLSVAEPMQKEMIAHGDFLGALKLTARVVELARLHE